MFLKYYFWRTLNVNTSDLSFWLITLGSNSSEINKEAEANQTKLKKNSRIPFGEHTAIVKANSNNKRELWGRKSI